MRFMGSNVEASGAALLRRHSRLTGALFNLPPVQIYKDRAASFWAVPLERWVGLMGNKVIYHGLPVLNSTDVPEKYSS